MANPLLGILNPGSISILGASNKVNRMGSLALLNIIGSAYGGRVYPIHPKEPTIQGIRAYPDLDSVPEVPELVILAIPAQMVPEALEQAGTKGIRRAVILAAGFSETGKGGRDRQKRIDTVARRYGIRYIGPNCIGFLNRRCKINTCPIPFDGRSGGIGLASHSGSYVGQTLPYAEEMDMGVAEWVSLGNEGDLDLTDALNYFCEQPHVKTIGLYIEAIRRPLAFQEAALRTATKKPIVALYAGGTPQGARSAASHTAASASPHKIMSGFLRQCGILQAATSIELYEWLNVFERQPLPRGPRVAILANSGGPATCMADYVGKSELDLPVFSEKFSKKISAIIPQTGSGQNPIDFTFSPDIAGYAERIPKLLAESDEIDAILVYGVFGGSLIKRILKRGQCEMSFQEEKLLLEKFDSQADTMYRTFKGCGKPVIGASFNVRKDSGVRQMIERGNIPFYRGPEQAVKALEALWRYKVLKDNIQTQMNKGRC